MSRLELGKEAVGLLTLYEEEVKSIAIVDTLRSLALCQTGAVQEASNAMVLVTDQAASESDRISSTVNVADADTGCQLTFSQVTGTGEHFTKCALTAL